MQFSISTLALSPDMTRLEAALVDLDPSALVDFDPSRAMLRLSTVLEPAQIARAVAAAGLPIGADEVQRVPSECCGGCGG